MTLLPVANEKSEVKRFRLLMALGVVLYPIWHVIYRVILEDPYDPLWQRLALAFLFAACGVASFLVDFSKSRRELLVNVLVWAMTSHFVFLCEQNHFRFEYLFGLMIVIEAAHLVIMSMRAFILYQIYAMVLTASSLLLGGGLALANKVVFFCAVVTLAIINFVAHVQHALFREKEHDRALYLAEQQAKMAALGDATAGLAHEIKNILTIAIVYATSISEKLDAPEPDREGASRISGKMHGVLARMLKITQSLQSFAYQPKDVPPAVEALHQLIEESIDVVSSKAKRWGVTIRNGVSPELTVYCVGNQMSQVLVNLLNNAIDAVNEAEDRWVDVSGTRDGQDIVIRVVDSGPAIPPEVRSRMMEPYFTTKRRGEGTGLGLSISRSLIESKGGTLTLDKDATRTTFVIRMKASAPDEAPGAA